MVTTSTSQAGLPLPTLNEEAASDDLAISGSVPSWLSGTLLRLTLADFDVDGRRLNHLFDGSSMLHRFSISDGRVSYANRFLQTNDRRARVEEGRIAYRQFAQDPCRSLFKRFQTLFRHGMTDNANVNLVRLGQQFIAMTETPLPVAFDARTLEAAGVTDALPPGPGTAAHVTAHPHHDGATGALMSFAAEFGPRPRYRVYTTTGNGNGASREVVASMPERRPSYMHSFSITERYVILAENPLIVDPLRLAVGGRPFIESYRWRPERGTRFQVFDRSDGSHRATLEGAPAFCFHHVNAFEESRGVVVDLMAHDDAASVVDQLYLERLEQGSYRLPQARLRRYRLDLEARTVQEEDLCGERFELPRINYGHKNGRPYRYVYGSGFLPETSNAPSPPLVKADVGDGSVTSWREQGCLPGEPIFVPGPPADAEDEGFVLSVVLDADRGGSFLLVLDAQTFEERARAEAPHAVPLSFHGNWFPRDEGAGER